MARFRPILRRWSALLSGSFVSERTPLPRIQQTLLRLWPFDPGIPLVRLGRDFDGGYLVPDDLDGIVACFSPGVDRHASFEQDLARRGVRCHLLDASVEGPPPGCDGMSFERLFLGSSDTEARTTLGEWVTRHEPQTTGDLLLQMDIEGAEFDVVPNVDAALLRRFRVVVIEFHKLDWVAQPFVRERMEEVFAKLAIDFVPVHLHANNTSHARAIGPLRVPRAVEVTYLRRDRCRSLTARETLDHPLDRDNVPDRPAVFIGPGFGVPHARR
jgi:hypothetical protein